MVVEMVSLYTVVIQELHSIEQSMPLHRHIQVSLDIYLSDDRFGA